MLFAIPAFVFSLKPRLLFRRFQEEILIEEIFQEKVLIEETLIEETLIIKVIKV